MSRKFMVDEDWMRKNVLSNPTVTSALNAKARRLAPIVKRIALKEDESVIVLTQSTDAGRPLDALPDSLFGSEAA